MGRALMGYEQEYSYAAFGRDGLRLNGAMDRLENLARRTTLHLLAEDRGIFLANGSLFYRDPGGGGAHLEIATGEVASPTDAVLYARAGDRFMADLAARQMREEAGCAQAFVARNHVDYSADPATWGSHESYLTRRAVNDLAPGLLAHLTTRMVFTGGGGFNPLTSGLEFLISPRAAFIFRAVGPGNESDRPILHTRDESHSTAGHRLHITSGDGLNSQRALWLRFATTSLIAAALDAGLQPGEAVLLGDAVSAMKRFARDPSLTAVALCRDGRERTAVAVQRYYCEWVREQVAADFMPPWAEEAVREWSAMLDRLESGGAAATARTLDWAIKHGIYTERLRRRGLTWEAVKKWNRRVRRIECAVSEIPAGQLAGYAILTGADLDDPEQPVALARAMAAEGVERDALRDFFKLRAEFCEIDTAFSRLDARGLFVALDSAGKLDHRVPGIDERLAHALEHPPEGTRAFARGALVRAHAGSARAAAFRVGWAWAFDSSTGSRLDISDPFSTEMRWKTSPPARAPQDPGFMEMVRDMFVESPPPREPIQHRLEVGWEAYRRGHYNAAQRALRAIGSLRSVTDGEKASYFRLTGLVESRQGFTGGSDAIERMCAGAPPGLAEIVDHICVLRFQGLTPPPAIDPWLERAHALIGTQAHALRGALLDHEGFTALRRGEVEKAHTLLSRACADADIRHEPRSHGRALADLADACRAAGRIDEARQHLDAAERILLECGDEGERLDSVCLVRAKIAAHSPATAQAILDPAIAALHERGAKPAEARARLLRARITRSSSRDRSDALDLCLAAPSLHQCPLMLKIIIHWQPWIAGAPPPDGHSDAEFWGV